MKRFVFYSIALTLGFLFFFKETKTQNLIPNPGFEELFTEAEYQWVQPLGAYYHYQKKSIELGGNPLSGLYENGICMYNMEEPNEYLHVKLLKPLEKGVQYKLEVNARLMRSKSFQAHLQRYIGVYFGNEKINTHKPNNLPYQPQIHLKLPEGDRYEWFQMVDTFTATGGEAYLTMGYFPKTLMLENKEYSQEEFLKRIDERYALEQQKKEVSEDKSWLYMPPDEQKKYLKQQKKKKKGPSKEVVKPTQVRKPCTEKSEKTGSDYGSEFNDKDIRFAVRYYFDDLCLVPIRSGEEEPECYPDNKPETIAAGKVINLRNVFFETNSATLLPESEFQLNALHGILEDYPKMRIEIRGYTDNVGTAAYNLSLSERRAKTVLDWLVNKGVSKQRVSSQGFGMSHPIDTNDTEEGRARNRRVMFLIVEM